MPENCTCPDLSGMSYEDALTASGLAGSRSESKNCCEPAGYICPNMSSMLDAAKSRRDTKARQAKKKGVAGKVVKAETKSSSRNLRKRPLAL